MNDNNQHEFGTILCPYCSEMVLLIIEKLQIPECPYCERVIGNYYGGVVGREQNERLDT